MSRIRLFFSLLLSSLVFLSFAAKADETQTQTIISPSGERQVIVTTVPTPKVIVPAPSGSTSCFTVAAGWNNDLWVPEHQVCNYSNSTEGVAWIAGYWACNKYKNGECTNWDWREGHWVKTFSPY